MVIGKKIHFLVFSFDLCKMAMETNILQILGLICFILGLVVLVMDLKCPDDINTFFGNDTLNDLEEFYVSKYWRFC